jgi:hypothetical protein
MAAVTVLAAAGLALAGLLSAAHAAEAAPGSVASAQQWGADPPPTSTVPPIQIGPTAPATPVTTAPTTSPGADPGSDPAWWDLGGQVRKAINDWFRDLVRTGLESTLDLLANSILSTPDLTTLPAIASTWASVQVIANTVFVLFILAGGIIVMSHESLQSRFALKEILPRIVVGFAAANVSLSLVSQGIQFANALSAGLVDGAASTQDVINALKAVVLATIATDGIFRLLLETILDVLIIVLLVVWIGRMIATAVLTTAAPILLACHATPYTEGLARWWWRAVIGLLTVQAAQALTLVVAMKAFFQAADSTQSGGGWLAAGSGIMALLVFLVLIYIEIKIPFWVFRMVWGTSGGSMLGSLVKVAVMGKVLGMLGLGRGSHRAVGLSRAASGSRRSVTPEAAHRAAGAKASRLRWGPIPESAWRMPADPPDLEPAPLTVTPPRAHQRLDHALARVQAKGDRARERAIRAYTAPTASSKQVSATTGPVSQPAHRLTATPAVTASAPAPISRTPARISATAAAARTPAPGAVTPPRMSAPPPSTAPAPPARPARRPAVPDPTTATPARISATPTRLSTPTPPASTGVTPPRISSPPPRISAAPERISTSQPTARVQPATPAGEPPRPRRRRRRRGNPPTPSTEE